MKNGLYEMIIAPLDYPGKKYRGRYCYEHHFVFWKKNGFLPPKGFEIHHINGKHRDNRIENLKLVTSQEHKEIHNKIRREKTYQIVKCGFCEKSIEIRGSTLRSRMKNNSYAKVFCNRVCGAKHQHSVVAGGS